MKKIGQWSLVLASVLVLSACGGTGGTDDSSASSTAETSQQSVVEQHATVILQEDGKEISIKEVDFKEGDNLFTVMSNSFDIKDQDGFITSIDGHAQDDAAKKYWTYTINDKEVMTGAKEVILKEGDKVIFNLAPM